LTFDHDALYFSQTKYVLYNLLSNGKISNIHPQTVQPGNQTFLAAGLWQPGKNELETLRAHIKHSSANLRSIISAPEFVAHFGEPKPVTPSKSAKKGDSNADIHQLQRSSIFGREDELKVAPKGVDKNHP
jgi:hypothetical protein